MCSVLHALVTILAAAKQIYCQKIILDSDFKYEYLIGMAKLTC